MPENMAAQVITNKESAPSDPSIDESNKVIKFAPGENKIPTNPLKEEFMDAKAFPRHHPTGKYGLNHKRKKPLTPVKYFAQRILNKNPQFSQDADYVFVAQQFGMSSLLYGLSVGVLYSFHIC